MEEKNFSELGGTLWVSPSNNMYGRFNVVANGDDYLEGTFMTRASGSSDLHSTMDVRVQRNSDLNSTVDIKYRNESDLSATLHPTNANFLEVSLDVRPFNVMYGMFDIIEPPRLTETKNPSQDATVRSLEEYRYINFGKSSTMMVGQSDDETLYSYIKFDLSSYTDTMTFEKAKLRIHYPSTMENDILELWTIDRHWAEYGVTYANKPLPSELVSKKYTIDKDKKYIEFEVLDYVQSIVNGGQENYGLELRGSSGKTYSMFTRETNKAPELISTYFDSRVWNTGRSELEAVLYAYGNGESDLTATLNVHTDMGEDTLESTLYVHRYDTPVCVELEAMLTVSNPELKSSVTVAQTDYYDFNASLTVRKSREEDYPIFLAVSNPELHSTVFVKYNDYLDTTVTVRALEEDGLVSGLSISNPELSATLYAKYHSDLNAYFTVNVNKEEFLPSVLAVSNPELRATLTPRVIGNDDLAGELVVIGKEESIRKSILTVSNPELRSTLLARQVGDSDLTATLSVRVVEEDDVISFISVNNPELDGTIYVRYYNDLEGTILIYQNDESELESYLTVSQPELSAVLQPRIFEEREVYLNVSNPELHSIIITRAYAEDDVDAFLHPKVLGASDLNATLGFINKSRSGAYYYIL